MNKTKLVSSATFILSGFSVFAAAPTDGDIVATLHAANHAEEASSKVIEGKSSNADVLAFAKMMVTAHTGVDRKLDALSGKDGLKPTENMDSRKIEMKTAVLKKELELADAKSVDKSFMEKQISMHQDVLEAIDKKLIPSAKNPELKALLTEVRGSVIEHIHLAQSTLKKL